MISLIIPTLGERLNEINRLFDSLEKQNMKELEVIVVSQGNHESIKKSLSNTKLRYKHIESDRRGLSISRNIGLKYVSGDIVTFSDDDCWYPNEALSKVKDYMDREKSDIACFNIFDPINNIEYKNYRKESKNNIQERDLFRISSIEIFVNLKNVKKEYILFDDRFGLGSKYSSGEENIFLIDIFNRGYSVDYYPETVVYHKSRIGKVKFNTQQAYAKGALFKRMFPSIKGLVYINVLMIKKINILENKFKCIINANKGFFKFK